MGCSHSKDGVAAVHDCDVSSQAIGSYPRSASLQRLSRRSMSGSTLDEYRRAAALSSWTRPVPVDQPRRRRVRSPLVEVALTTDVASPVVSPNPLAHADGSISRSTTPTETQQPDTPLVFSALSAQSLSRNRSLWPSGDFDVHHIGDGSSNSIHLARSCDATDGDGASDAVAPFILRDALQPPSSGEPRSLPELPSVTVSTLNTGSSLHDEQRKRSAAILRRHRAVSHEECVPGYALLAGLCNPHTNSVSHTNPQQNWPLNSRRPMNSSNLGDTNAPRSRAPYPLVFLK